MDSAEAAAKVALAGQNCLLTEFTERLSALQQAPLTRHDGGTFYPDSPPT